MTFFVSARGRVQLRWLIVLCWVIGACQAALAQPGGARRPAPIVLQPVAIGFTPREFYVARVVDARPPGPAVAHLLLSGAGEQAGKTTQAVDLQGGAATAVQQFIRRSLPVPNPQLRPVTVRLENLQVTERALPGAVGQVGGYLAVRLAFEWVRDGRTISLTTYAATARYARPVGELTVVEPTIRQALAAGLRYFNTWLNQQAGSDPQLATGIRLSFAYHTHDANDDTVFYTPTRPLTWADFQAPPKPGPHAAVVFPSFSYKAFSRVVDGRLLVEYQLKIFVLKSSSWVAASGRTAGVLAHEQRHFDLTKLVAEHFRQRLAADPRLTVDYYQEGNLEYQYLLALQELTRVQAQYDAETHGNPAAQVRWNQQIDEELRAVAGKQ